MYDSKQLKQLVNIQDLAKAIFPLLVSDVGSGRQMTGVCPKCGGGDRFGVFADGWFCRQCKPLVKGKNHDCFELAMHVGKASTFADAVQFVGDWLNNPTTIATMKPVATTISKRVDWTAQEWQTAASKEAQAGQQALKFGMSYMLKRGLTLETCQKWGVGYGNGWSASDKAQRRGVKFVWSNAQGQITGIHTRFIEPDSAKKRYSRFVHPHNATGSAGKMTLYRLIDGNSDTLYIVEGEINALSVWQTTGAHVASFGSESLTADAMNEAATLARNYQRVVIWADKSTVGAKLAALIPGAKAIKSPKGLDANDLLVAGKLNEFLQAVIERIFSNAPSLVRETATSTREKAATITTRQQAQTVYAELFAKSQTGTITDDEHAQAWAIIRQWGDVKVHPAYEVTI